MKRLIIGCGFLGQRVADRWVADRDDVHVLTRSVERATLLAARGLIPIVGDVTDPATIPPLPTTDTLLWAVGHDRSSGQSIQEVYVGGLRNILAKLPSQATRIIFVSSTGVYGQQDGCWVDETSACEPVRAGGKACLSAERTLLASPWSNRTVICRLAGIYGAGRLPRLEEVMSGTPLPTDPDAVINLIHVEDAARALVCVAGVDVQSPRVYLIADGNPVTRRDFYSRLAELVGAPPPRFELILADGRRRQTTHKLVSNQRMMDELRLKLEYPSYREGLTAVGRGVGGSPVERQPGAT